VSTASNVAAVLDGLSEIRSWQETLYRDIHQHPELSHQEHRTASLATDRLRSLGYDVRDSIGGTGVVGVLRNGSGPMVLMRADMVAGDGPARRHARRRRSHCQTGLAP
jgi:metal-dependent amidase/aminoacylase/carboxypeptidase family protein